ncbi:MAG: response regulator [Chitinophagaceae bacterium]
MNSNGTIIIIDDDKEDLELFLSALESLGICNTIYTFDSPTIAIDYIRDTNKPIFFILCDINMPLMNGFELRSLLTSEEGLLLKSTPFIFFSTASNKSQISKAYENTVQGYFQKPSSFDGIRSVLKSIVEYWSSSMLPVDFET